MKYRQLGRTDLTVSELAFGCGNTAGLFTAGSSNEQKSVLHSALDMGVTLFDTSPAYEDSEVELGRALKAMGSRPTISSKVMLHPEDFIDIPNAVRRGVENSLRRLQVDHIDIMELHNRLGRERDHQDPVKYHALLTLNDVLGEHGVVDTLERLRDEGKLRAIGFTALGDTETDMAALKSGRFDVIQTYYNLLNPSAGHTMPVMFRHKNFLNLMSVAEELGTGVLAVRALGAGALASADKKHPLAPVLPSMAAAEWESDSLRSQIFGFLAENQTLGQAAIRFTMAHSATSAVVVGVSDERQLTEYVAAIDAGPLSDDDVAKVLELFRDPYL